MRQPGEGALLRPKILIGTYGSDALAEQAMAEAARTGSTLVVCFIRSVRLDYRWDRPLSMDTDQAALKTFSRFLDIGHQMGMPVLPIYDTGDDAAMLVAEAAAMSGCERILIGSSRQGAVYHLIEGNFFQRLEAILPEEIKVPVVRAEAASPAAIPAEAVSDNAAAIH
jgi:hypothetical protein